MSDGTRQMPRLPDHVFDAIVTLLDRLGPLSKIVPAPGKVLSLPSVEQDVAKAIEAPGEAPVIVNAILNLHRFRSSLGMESDAFASSLSARFAERVAANLELAEKWASQGGYLASVLDENGPFGLLDKSMELAYTHQNLMRSARILTDVRPVLDSQAERVVQFVIVHKLVVDYFEGSAERTLHLALDSSDLLRLAAQCERAEKKTKIVAEALSASGCGILAVRGVDE